MNLAQIADWGREWALVDVFKHSRPWIEHGPGPFAYDARGYPRSVTVAIRRAVRSWAARIVASNSSRSSARWIAS